MRINMPITQQENNDLREGELICSKTNAQGVITYANDALCRISGFPEHELLGSPHNIMRHPDMPRVAYAWMWDTLNRGLLWQAMVKNRCKNGDHYWVDANVSRQYGRDGCVIGYLSTRRKPTRTQIDEAEALYATLRQAEIEIETRSSISPEAVTALYQSSPLYKAH